MIAGLASHHDSFALSAFADNAHSPGRSGLYLDGVLVDLEWALSRLGDDWRAGDAAQAWLAEPAALERFFAIDGWRELAADAVAHIAGIEVPPEFTRRVDDVVLLPPVRRPEKIVALALNYVSHSVEANRELPKYPSIFAKYANSLCGARDDVRIPHASHRIDYEGELAVIIGRTAFAISEAEADSVIAGYAVANDVSARDYQARTPQITQGKIFDGFCPLGPAVRCFQDASGMADLTLRTTVNGEQRQSAPLKDMIFSVPFVVAYLSQIMTLRPGDVILTGTPGGIGGAMNPRRWLRDGDVVDIEIEGIGAIRNRFVESSGQA
jgi:acylpyruvate hydrolase